MPSSTDLPTPNFTYDPDVALKCGHVAAKLDAPMEIAPQTNRRKTMAGPSGFSSTYREERRRHARRLARFTQLLLLPVVFLGPAFAYAGYLPTLNAVKRPWIFRCQAEVPRSA
jgi:hypothetical protein